MEADVVYSDFEIVQEYKMAQNPALKREILHQVTLKSYREIDELLLAAGIIPAKGRTAGDGKAHTRTAPPKFYKGFNPNRARELWEQGLCDRLIAIEMGTTVTTVCNWRIKTGLVSQRERRKQAEGGNPSGEDVTLCNEVEAAQGR